MAQKPKMGHFWGKFPKITNVAQLSGRPDGIDELSKVYGWVPGQILQILMAQNLYFTKLYNIPEMIKHVDPAKHPQSTLVIFGNLPPKRPIFGFWAIILEPHQINPKFLHFLNALRCPDLGQEESQKVGSTLVITFVA